MLLARQDASVASVARHFGISRSTLTLYKYVPELHDGGPAAVRESVQAEALAAYDAQQITGHDRATDARRRAR